MTARLLLAWWGSFTNGGGATIGDLAAVENVSHKLFEAGIDHVVASSLPLPSNLEHFRRELRTDWEPFDYFVFVCGPLIDSKQLRDIVNCMPSARKIAVGVSTLDSEAGMNGRFDYILSRDGFLGESFDLALARLAVADLPGPSAPEVMTSCLNPMLPLHSVVERTILQSAHDMSVGITNIDTVIDPETNPLKAIQDGFEAAGVVVTTRLHGALYSLANGHPTIAIDLVERGGKLSAAMKAIGWPVLLSGHDIDERSLSRAFAHARSPEIMSAVETCRASAIARSKAALDRATEIICSATGARSTTTSGNGLGKVEYDYRVRHLEIALANAQCRLDELGSLHSRQIKELEEVIAQYRTRILELEQRISSLEEVVAQYRGRILELEDVVAKYRARILELE